MIIQRMLACLVVAVAAVSASPSAHATFITGSIDVLGTVNPVDSLGNPVTLATATGLHFVSANIASGTQTGDLTAIPNGAGVTMSDFQFAPFSGPLTPLYISLGGPPIVSFDLLTDLVEVHTATSLDMSGSGTLHLTGFDPTPGTWNFSTQLANPNQITVSFSSSTTSVPEPATLGLVGMGLLGVGLVLRRRRRVA